MHPRDELRLIHAALVERHQRRFPGEPVEPFPEAGDLNEAANVNRRILGRLLGQPPLQVTVKREPVVFPLREREPRDKRRGQA